MCIIRQSINRHMKQPPHSKPYDIMTRFEFEEANNTFKAMCKKLRKEGKGQVEHIRSIEKGDISGQGVVRGLAILLSQRPGKLTGYETVLNLKFLRMIQESIMFIKLCLR